MKIKIFDAMSDDYIRSLDVDGYDRVTSNAGVKVSPSGKFIPIPGGLYDPAIFGKEFFNSKTKNLGAVRKCSCGAQRKVGRCGSCHEVLLDTVDYMTKSGYYQFCVPFVGVFKDDELIKSIRSIIDYQVVKEVKEKYKLSLIDALWSCEFIPMRIPDPGNNPKVVRYMNYYYSIVTKEADENSVFSNCGLVGLYKILSNYKSLKGESFTNALKFLNYNLVIPPVKGRPVSRGHDGKPTYPAITGAFAQVIQLDKIAQQIIFGQGGAEGSILDKLAIAASINNGIVGLCKKHLPLIKESKQSVMRNAGTGRVPSSFRANIITAKTSMDTVLVPKALAYEACRGELLERLEAECYGTNLQPIDLYNDPNERVMQIFEDMVENSIALIGRQPTLYKFGQLAFHCRLWKESDFTHPVNVDKIACLGLNVVVSTPFNADFDGDQMYCILFTKSPDKEEVYKKAGVAHNWIYQKNNESVFVPKKSILAGLHVGTKLYRSNYPIPEYYKFKSFTSIQRLYVNKQIMFNTPLELNGELTTYGILKVSDILHRDLKDILRVESNEQIDINSSSMKLISAHITTMPDRVDAINGLMDLGSSWIKQYGSSLIRLSELYKVDTKFPEIEAILKSKRSEKEKFILLDKQLNKIVTESVKKMMPGLSSEMAVSGVKPASVIAMIQPTISYGKEVKISNRSLLSGLGEEEFVNHAATTREILKQKAQLVPLGGYINKCVTDCLSNFIYKAGETSPDQRGILVKRKDAIGRYDLNDNPIGYNEDDSLVRIKSCIYDLSERKFHVASDELNQALYQLENNGVVGVLSANATTEEITQSQLALKHGGNLFSPSLECITAKENLKVIEIADKYIVLAKGVDRYVYPLPKKFLLSQETIECLSGSREELKKDEVVFYIDEMQYVDYKIKRIGSVIGFQSGGGNKENFNPSATIYKSNRCFSPCEGIIHYDFENRKVTIGTYKTTLHDDVVYYYADGEKVPMHHQFCSGTMSPKDIMAITNDYETRFQLFYAQIKKLMPKLQLLSIELLFKSLFGIGSGTLISAISKDPFQLMKNQKGLHPIKRNLGREYEYTLQMDMIVGLHMRDML